MMLLSSKADMLRFVADVAGETYVYILYLVLIHDRKVYYTRVFCLLSTAELTWYFVVFK